MRRRLGRREALGAAVLSPQAIGRLWVDDACLACGLCEDICPDVFDVSGEVARIRDEADLEASRAEIYRAMEICPVDAVFVEVDEL